jgi:lariat debranching enzyme
MSALTVAVEGCAHGNLDEIYDSILQTQKANGITIDLLLCCGDFQSIRNEQDMECLACPVKYRSMVGVCNHMLLFCDINTAMFMFRQNSFYKYYSGQKKAPVLTIFIGGNHEASNYLQVGTRKCPFSCFCFSIANVNRISTMVVGWRPIFITWDSQEL